MKNTLVYIYPHVDKICNETNLLRIINNEIKETLILYLVRKNDNLDLYLSDTSTGENNELSTFNNIEEIENILSKIKCNEETIITKQNFDEIKKYIFNLVI